MNTQDLLVMTFVFLSDPPRVDIDLPTSRAMGARSAFKRAQSRRSDARDRASKVGESCRSELETNERL